MVCGGRNFGLEGIRESHERSLFGRGEKNLSGPSKSWAEYL